VRTLGRVLVRALVPVLVTGGFLVPGLQPVATATTGSGTPGYCTDATGVTVVVDFQELGGGVVIRCFPHPTSSSTGLAALEGAGFTPTGTVRFGLGFICRIEGQPTKTDEPCIDTPPATAYWSYWYAPNGGSWKYSDLGVTNHKVILGGFEGWSFAKDKTSATLPPPRVAPNHSITTPTPTPTQKPTTAPAARPTTQPASHSTAVPAPGASTPSAPSPAAGTTTSGSTPSGGAAAAASTASGPPISYSVARRESGNGSATSAIAGLALVVAALGAAGAVALRRRRDRAEGG
jgi:hypothetical protein